MGVMNTQDKRLTLFHENRLNVHPLSALVELDNEKLSGHVRFPKPGPAAPIHDQHRRHPNPQEPVHKARLDR